MGLLEKLNRQASLMGRMMVAVGAIDHIPETHMAESQLRQAASRCMGCGHPGECAGWLENHPDGAEKTPEFCPNQMLFEDWKAGR